MEDLKEHLSFAINMARAAGQIQLDYFRSSSLGLKTKQNDSDVVTDADKASETLIKSMIHDKYPSHGIISEESDDENADREWRWVIDPLDGTTNFSQGLPIFSVSIALEHFGSAVVGVVYAPYIDEMFYAIQDGGSYLNGKKICCSSKKKISECVVATGMPYDKNENPDNNLKEISLIAPVVRGIRRMGSAAVDLSYVAAGFLDGYWELNLNRWDVAAGVLIAEEAGAVVSKLRQNRNYSLLASSPSNHKHLLTLLTH